MLRATGGSGTYDQDTSLRLLPCSPAAGCQAPAKEAAGNDQNSGNQLQEPAPISGEGTRDEQGGRGTALPRQVARKSREQRLAEREAVVQKQIADRWGLSMTCAHLVRPWSFGNCFFKQGFTHPPQTQTHTHAQSLTSR